MVDARIARPRIAIFGSSGAIGSGLAEWFAAREWDVTAIVRQATANTIAHEHVTTIVWDPLTDRLAPSSLSRLDAVVWAQGDNCTDDIANFDYERHMRMYEANVGHVLVSLNALLNADALVDGGARMCIISSIWQNIARQNKLSYCTTKSALQGLVRSVSLDLAKAGHVINAVLPGALDTPMTRANLSSEQIARLEAATPGLKLAGITDVAAMVEFCCSPTHRSITGQFLTVDKGFTHARII
ncbi:MULTISPECIES: SDR family NAD(P)-dependent oxidoreductase [unclassified Pseudomonas]|uniref:SDR family NAD(P)-dependent oxidoreductase n=1 Tax=unclassified Pseudomonas TaxID=196821 RepID=UPI001C489CC5|nr:MULTISPECIES: SDR family oxidoreductase [unclassified Pseudomonas]